MNADLLERFCTPQAPSFTEYDSKAFADAERIEYPFEEINLHGYCWGKGKTVILVHGWGSRASHLAHLGRMLAKLEMRVIVYDAPAHYSSNMHPDKSTSNMFEYCRALSAIAKKEESLYALIGHSFGAFCAALAVSGRRAFTNYKISAEKLIMISSPPTLTDVLKSFCKNNGLDSSGLSELKESLEERFSFSVDDYDIKSALQSIDAKTLMVHDSDDKEFSLADINSIQKSLPHLQLFITQGYGHQKILMNRAMIARIKEFLL
jgi:pimeloyl-ACP methyl ester carboxylesterase